MKTSWEIVALLLGTAACFIALVWAITYNVSADRDARQEVKLEVLRVCDGSEDVAECMQEAKETLD